MPPRTRSTVKTTGSRGPYIYLWIPNLIGYTRVVLTLLSIYYAFSDWIIFVVAYSVSAILDLFDGMAARKFDQCSKFGGILDMVTDRVSTNMLYIVLAVMFPKHYFVFAVLAGLDYSSHWAQMYAAAASGTHHKVLEKDRNWLLRFYYSNRPFMFMNCVCQEAALIGLYAWYHAGAAGYSQLSLYAYYLVVGCLPLGGIKQLINVIQLMDACKQIVKVDVKEWTEKRA